MAAMTPGNDGMGHQHRISCINIRVGSWQNFSQGNRELLLEACHDRDFSKRKWFVRTQFTGSLVCIHWSVFVSSTGESSTLSF